jgi:hypothetical protein
VYHGDDMDANQNRFFQTPIDLGIMRTIPYDLEQTGLSTTAIIQRIVLSTTSERKEAV